MKYAKLLSLFFTLFLFGGSGFVFANSCGAAFDRGGACARNCVAANPDCTLRNCVALCGGADTVTNNTVVVADARAGEVVLVGSSPTTVAYNRANVNRIDATRGAVNRGVGNRSATNRNGGVDRVGVRR